MRRSKARRRGGGGGETLGKSGALGHDRVAMPRAPKPPRTPPRAKAEPDARPPEGGLIGFDSDGAIGWAWYPDRPDRLVSLVLRAGAEDLARCMANRFGDPRIETLTGPGVPGFAARLTHPPACGVPFQLSVHAAEDGRQLGAALPVRSATELAALLGQVQRGAPQGHLDGIESGHLLGWARDPANPDLTLLVEVLDAGQPVAAGPANRPRPDLRDAGMHTGLYGFSIPLPARLLDGKPHSLTARVIGEAAPLPGGPVEFGPNSAVDVQRDVTALRGEVARLQTLVDGLLAPDGVAQRRMLQMLAERVAAFGEIQREQNEREMAALRAMVFAAAGQSVSAPTAKPDAGTQKRRRG